MKTISGLCLFLLGFAVGVATTQQPPCAESSRNALLVEDLAITRHELASTRIALDRLRRERVDELPDHDRLPPQHLPID